MLFRTLDAFRIFDNVFVMTGGAQDTETVSFLAYRQMITPHGARPRRRRLGAALRLRRALIAVLFVRGFRVDLGSCAGTTDERPPRARRRRPSPPLAIVGYALLPVLWIVALSFKRGDDIGAAAASGRRHGRSRTTAPSSRTDLFTSALVNSIGIALIATLLSVVLATLAAYAIARLEFPGKRWCSSWRWRSPCSRRRRWSARCSTCGATIGLYDTWPGLIIPYLTFALPLSIWTMSAFFRQIPWEMEQAAQVDGATPWQAFRKVIVPLAAPGVFTAAILTFFFCLERLPVRASR